MESERLSDHENTSPTLSLFDVVNNRFLLKTSPELPVQHFQAYHALHTLQRFFHKRHTIKLKAVRLICFKFRQFIANRAQTEHMRQKLYLLRAKAATNRIYEFYRNIKVKKV